MAMNLTPEEEALFNKQVTDEPGGIVIPDPIDIANGDATGDDIVVTPASGLAQDIINAEKAIEDSDNRYTNEYSVDQSFQLKVVANFHNFLRPYENEIRYSTGSAEATPWQESYVLEAQNVYYDVSTPYYPQGQATSPFTINEFPEELYQGAKITNPANLVTQSQLVRSAITTFTTDFTNTERSTDSPPQIENPEPPPTGLVDDPTYFIKKDAIYSAIDALLATMDSIITLTTAPIPDDQNSTAPQKAEARRLEVVAQRQVYQTLRSTLYLTDAAISGINTQEAQIQPTANARVLDIETNFILLAYYEVRKAMGIELADSSGTTYSKLSEVDNRTQLVKDKIKLERKLSSYESLASLV